jgi:hypothetical protein
VDSAVFYETGDETIEGEMPLSEINDNITALDSTWSSEKIVEVINNLPASGIDDDIVDTKTTWSSYKINLTINANISVANKYTDDQIVSKAVLYDTEQELTVDEVNIVRKNIHSVGQYATGLVYTPYTVVETGLNTSEHTVTETPLDPVVALDGAEIYNDYEGNIATGYYSIATGYKTQATGNYSRSNGWWTKASGQCSNSEGLLSVASGHFAHAEGTRTQATKNNAHSEGDQTVASGNAAHAEGIQSKATTNMAHAEGWATVASGIASHSEGEGTIAGGRAQTAMGKFNVKDTSSLLIIGNGTSDTARSNALKVTKAGDVEIAGVITATAIILRSSTEGSTKTFRLTVDDTGTISVVENT